MQGIIDLTLQPSTLYVQPITLCTQPVTLPLRCKGVIDLREARSCTATPRPDYNYEYSFEIVCGNRTWVLCPDDQHAMQESH